MDSKLMIAKNLIEVLEYIGDKLGFIVDWGSADLVPYLKVLAEKIVAYEYSIAVLYVIVATIVGVAAIAAMIIGAIKNWDDLVLVVCAALIVGAIILIVGKFHIIIACKTFPEKVVLEYITDIVNTSQPVG